MGMRMGIGIGIAIGMEMRMEMRMGIGRRMGMGIGRRMGIEIGMGMEMELCQTRGPQVLRLSTTRAPHVLDPSTDCLRRALRGRRRAPAPSFHLSRRGGAGGEAAPRRALPTPSLRRRGAAVGAERQRPVTGRRPGSSGRAPGLLRPRPRPPRIVPTPFAPPRPGAPPRPCERVPPAGPGEKGAIVRTFLPLLLDTHFPRKDADSSDNKGVCAFHPAEQKKEVNEDTALKKKKKNKEKKQNKKKPKPTLASPPAARPGEI